MANQTWDSVAIKGISGVPRASDGQRDAYINLAVSIWTSQGLTRQQISFGIALMNVESGFNVQTKSSADAFGLFAFKPTTWSEQLAGYNAWAQA